MNASGISHSRLGDSRLPTFKSDPHAWKAHNEKNENSSSPVPRSLFPVPYFLDRRQEAGGKEDLSPKGGYRGGFSMSRVVAG